MTIYFSGGTVFPGGIVNNVDQPNYEGHTVTAWWGLSDFATWYDILRNEQPLKFRYSFEGSDFDPKQPQRLLQEMELFTGSPEPPGEGPEDLQGKLISQPLLDLLRQRRPAVATTVA
ncbi:hypothetical protein ACFQX4_21210 [Roseomonas sp. GCM10028921]